MRGLKKERERKTLEVSIIGGGYERYRWERASEWRPGQFLWIKPEGEEREILVKVRGVSAKSAPKRLLSVRQAWPGRVKDFMVRYLRRYFRENELDVEVALVSFDHVAGILRLSYVAEEKLDLRHLGPKLAKLLHVRVELQQIGARDKARAVGGVGKCGLELCCKRFLREIPSVTLTMARKQMLFAAPDKLSGVCGRLLCCLRYEVEHYEEMAEKLPALGARVQVDGEEGEVVEVNYLLGTYKVVLPDGEERVLSVEGAPKSKPPANLEGF